MERPESGQHAESDHQEREEHSLESLRESDLLKLYQIEAAEASLREHRENSYPDEDAAPDQVEHQLHRAVLFGAAEGRELRAAPPHADQQVHRHDGQLVEQEEQEHVQRNEHTEHAGQEHKVQYEELLGAVGDVPGYEDPGEQHDSGQEHHRSRYAVDADMQCYRAVSERPRPGHREPVPGALELHPARLVVVGPEHVERQEHGQQSDGQREASHHQDVGSGYQDKQARAHHWKGDEQ